MTSTRVREITVGADDTGSVALLAQLRPNLFGTDTTFRWRGAASVLLARLEKLARAEGFDLFELYSGADRADAHRFYFSLGMKISGVHFTETISSA